MSDPVPQHTEALLRVLLDGGVELLVIGGVAAIAHGASTVTRDVDVAIPATIENMQRLLDALRPLDPVHFTRPDLPLHRHSAEELTKFRVLLLETRLGRLDVLTEVEPLGPADALPRVELPLVAGRLVGVLSREALIAVKRHVGRPKDLLVVRELEALESE